VKEIPTTLKVDSIGRVMLPKSIRDAYGIAPGDLVTIMIMVDEEKSEKKSEGLNPCEAVPSTLPVLA
jgi:AbrB family looped-hinge helix DNA binding protein